MKKVLSENKEFLLMLGMILATYPVFILWVKFIVWAGGAK